MSFNNIIIALLLLSVSGLSSAECHFNSTSALPLQLATSRDVIHDTRKLLLTNNRLLAGTSALAELELRDADSLVLFQQLNAWSDTDIVAAKIMAEPALLDTDMNGIADAVYVVDINGRVWFIPLINTGFARPELIADFSPIGAKFTQPLQLVQSTYQSQHGSAGYLQRVKVSLVLIASHDEQSDTLILFNHQPQLSRRISLNDLMDRTDLGADDLDTELTETVWRELQQSPGWLIQLEAKVMLKPQIYAGVVYFVTADIDADSEPTTCAITEDDETRLFALHLHHAGKVYAQRNWRIAAIKDATLQLKRSDEKLQLNLVSATEHSRVITEVLAITEHCADCTEALRAADYPRTLRLATYIVEYGAW